ncbi:MAG TPA: RsmD family RNA methyltransferase, partial [Terriglobales bacterium]|nr:RsmD family RNA methyltransferase [Terriglobales bacterium]
MRVIAGKYRHRALRAPRGLEVRPTSDRLRETLFNVLVAGRPEALEGTVWIDAFAGTGAVGIEALSRGARQVYFLENAKAAVAALRANLKALGLTGGFEV